MKRVTIFVTATFIIACIAIFTSVVLAQDNDKTKQDWSKLKIVTYSSGVTGFFDPDTGKLYLYDANLERCLTLRQLTELGEPMTKLRN